MTYGSSVPIKALEGFVTRVSLSQLAHVTFNVGIFHGVSTYLSNPSIASFGKEGFVQIARL